MTRRARMAALAPAVFAVLFAAAAENGLARKEALADFDALWKAVDREYAYFEGGHAPWRRARDSWRPRAAKAATRAELAAAIEGALDALHDDNVRVMERFPESPRRVPEDADIRARWRGSAATIESVRTFGDADVAGLKPGDVVLAVDGAPVDRAVAQKLPGEEDNPAARDWALRRILTGPRAGEMRVEVASGARRRLAVVERRDAAPAASPPVLARRVGDARDVGYLRLKGPLTDARLVPDFDAALDALGGVRALILDLREVHGAGSHEATAAILGRFVSAPAPWQLRETPKRKRVADTVSPRGAPFTAPLVVLVDRWTAGEGEALAAGLHAVAKARLVGTPMAGLRGETREVRAPHSGIAIRFPVQRVSLPDGSPRERLAPSVAVDLAQPQAGAGDPILYQALKLFE